jgi:hypothetical protein
VSGLHQLLLHHVLDFLDVDKRLLGRVHPGGHGLGDAHRRGGVALQRQEGFADRDFDLLLDERHDLVVATDDANVARRSRGTVDREFPAAIEEEALRNIVRIVVDQRLLDQLVERIERQLERRLPPGLRHEGGDQFADNAHHPAAVGRGENIALSPGQQHIRQRLAQRVSHFVDIKPLLTVRTQQGDLRHGQGFGRQ